MEFPWITPPYEDVKDGAEAMQLSDEEIAALIDVTEREIYVWDKMIAYEPESEKNPKRQQMLDYYKARLRQFKQLEAEDSKRHDEFVEKYKRIQEYKDQSISKLKKLPMRVYNLLWLANIRTIGDLLEKSYWDLVAIPQIGEKTIEATRESLSAIGLNLKNDDEEDYEDYEDEEKEVLTDNIEKLLNSIKPTEE
jgi:DNA-directed RNA polymerase alpha subunit